jgi:hypothetical protein
MRNVALFGKMSAGKSTIAAALSDAGYHKLSFATPLKNVAALAYGRVDKSSVYDVTSLAGDVSSVSGREVLQRVGQSIKSHDRDFWLRCFIRDAANYTGFPLVVDDGRFLFERDYLRSSDWLIVGVSCDTSVRLQRYQTLYGRYPNAEEMHHESEQEVDQIIQMAPLILQGTDDPYYNAKKILELTR